MELLVPFAPHKSFLIATAPLSFWMVSSLQIFFTKISSFIDVSIFEKIWRANIYYLRSCSCLCIIMSLHLYKEKYFVKFIFRPLSQSLHFSLYPTLDAHGIGRLLNFQAHFDYIKLLLYNRKIN